MTNHFDIVRLLRHPDNHPDHRVDLCNDAADEIERLRAELAEADALISTHCNAIDSNPRSSWPGGSFLEKAIARHAARQQQG